MAFQRKIVFDAARALGAKFDDAADVELFDRAIDEALRLAQAAQPAPRPSQGLGCRVSSAGIALMH